MAGASALGCLMMVAGCSQDSPIDAARDGLENLLLQEQSPVSRVVVSQDRVFVSLIRDGRATPWDVFPERVQRDAFDVVAPAMAVADFPVSDVLARAAHLVEDCTADTYEADATVASGTAILTRLGCGDEAPRVLLNNRQLNALPGDWSVETLRILWEELAELTTATRVESLFLEGEVAFVGLVPEPGTNAECRLLWRRDVADPANSLTECRGQRPPVEVFDLHRMTPERLAGTILGAKSELGLSYDAALDSVLVVSVNGEPSVQATHGDQQVTLPIR
ncbi:hypothetical protein EAX62_13375 [Tessaracoccus antarcticus]|uniref:Uncharacterized protein n=1 Tax=Tessaracoccus antarcticus TaxID=2479848 RepID=A0A3M0FZU0_9ACTN|nr:hypothetical protein EAX62_13375 [Tessaracoccus antarcticus]